MFLFYYSTSYFWKLERCLSLGAGSFKVTQMMNMTLSDDLSKDDLSRPSVSHQEAEGIL